MVDEKSVTQCNSAHVSFENRVKDGGFFAKCTALRGSAVGRLRWAASRDAERAAPFVASVRRWDAAMGQADPSGPRNRMTFSNFQ